MNISGYRAMWLIAMFDLPVQTPSTRRAAARFRIRLRKNGFTMMQYSVYIRHCASQENVEVHIQRVKAILPAEGEVRLITFTDKQFERMQVFYGKIRKKTEDPPLQLEFF